MRTQDIALAIGGRETRGYLAVPDGAGPWPGVVVIQEWWGLNDNIRSVARDFAAEGFVALAPDLYFGESATEPDDARKLAMAMQWPEALAVIQVAIDTLLARDDVRPKKVGITGFCMGGGLAWHAAAKLSNLAAAVPFYGGGPELTPDEVTRIRVPVLAIFGELDRGVGPEVAQRRATMMDAAGITHETIVYPEAQHAFFNKDRSAYHPQAAADAWQRMLILFRTVVTGDSTNL